MNNIIKNPIGVDVVIQKVQTYLYDKLNWDPIEVYGRAYKNPISEGLVPQFYDSCGEYKKDIYITDKKGNSGNIFFVLEDKHKAIDSFNFKVETKIVFMLNLKKIYRDEEQRQDSKAQKDAWNIVKNKKQFKIKYLETGLKTVLKGFYLDNIKHTDIEPLHIFALVGDLKYSINNC